MVERGGERPEGRFKWATQGRIEETAVNEGNDSGGMTQRMYQGMTLREEFVLLVRGDD